MTAEIRCFMLCHRSSSQAVDAVTKACENKKLKTVSFQESEWNDIDNEFKEFLGQSSLDKKVFAFFTRYKRIVFGPKAPVTYVVLMDAKDNPETNKLAGERLRRLATGQPVFFILLVSRDRNDVASVPWDIELQLMPTTDAERASTLHALSVKNILTMIALARRASFVGIREGLFWRRVDLLLFAVFVPLLIGLISGFSEGLGQCIFNALATPTR